MASLADSLWHRNRVLAEAALEHTFVQGIASGELARATFAYYVGQDAAFLDAFCRAYALALAKSPDQDGLIAFRELLDAAADELRLHRGYADRWDVDLHQAADPATAAYTNFLLAVAALEPVGHIAAAMTPCMRLYAYLGQQLAAQTKPDSPYREWVMTYSSPQFEALARRVEGLLDRYGGDHDRLADLYHQAMEHNRSSSTLSPDARDHDCDTDEPSHRLVAGLMAPNGPLSRCPPQPLGDEHRAHDSQSGEFSGHYATSFLVLDNCLRQSLPVREERHGQIMRGQQRLHRAARDRSRQQKTLRPVASMVHQGPCGSRGFDPLCN